MAKFRTDIKEVTQKIVLDTVFLMKGSYIGCLETHEENPQGKIL